MPHSAGDRLGPYEILTAVGAGGMGDLYRARDTRLGRIVAIKVSKEQFSERFGHEARAVAALNHPHICQLYDVGPDYLVMEFVEGTPLEGPLPLEKAVECAGQIGCSRRRPSKRHHASRPQARQYIRYQARHQAPRTKIHMLRHHLNGKVFVEVSQDPAARSAKRLVEVI